MTKTKTPTGWKEVKLENIADIKGGYAFKSSLMSSFPQKYQIIKMGNVYANKLDLNRNASFLENVDEKENNYLLKEKDIIISLTGTVGKKDFGYVVQINKHENLLLNQRLALFRSEAKESQSYLFYKISHKSFLDVFFESAKGGTGNQTNVSINVLKTIPILLPPLPEQNRITAILETWDKYLEKLARKIEIKKNVKKGLMQRLLSGDVRLEGFSGEWEVVKLGEVLKIKHGKPQKEVEIATGKYPILGTGGEIGRTNDFLYNKPSVLIGRKGTIDKPKYMDTPFWTVDTLFYSEINDKYSPKFIYFYFLTINWKLYNEGSGIPSLSASTISSIKVCFPKSKPEQTAIAKILTTADQEIEALEKKKMMIEDQKKYLLNNLITGKMRTV